MGGGGNPISRAVKKVTKPIKKEVEKTFTLGEESLVDKFGGGRILKEAGLDYKKLNPVAQAKRAFVDKPKQLKEEQKRMAADAKRENEAQLKRLGEREAQEGAEKAAGETLAKGRRRQAKRKKKAGRESTILTDTLGTTGGEAGGKKTLLGL